jgi:tetratricopeptide (TPR) repeat protein
VSEHAQSLWTIWLSEAYLLAGREADASAAAQRALGLARQHKERGHEAYTLRLLGEIASHGDSPDLLTAEDHYRQALVLAEELGMRPLVAHCHVALGKLYRRTGKQHQAKEHLITATSMMREMQMGLWLEKAETELNELG